MKAEVEIWKMVEGKPVELFYNNVVYRRVDHLLIEDSAKQKETQQQDLTKPKPKYPPILNKGKPIVDNIALSIYQKTKHRIREGIVNAFKDYLSTGWRSRKQIVEWFEVSLELAHTSAGLCSGEYTQWLDANNKLEESLIEGEKFYRLKEIKASTREI